VSAEPPFYLVWREDGPAPTVKHKTITAAENEAERLAKAMPGATFYVLIPSSCTVERRVTVHRFDVTACDIPF
jgi:hypothetical protein